MAERKGSVSASGDDKLNCGENSNSEDELEIDTKFITKLQPFDLKFVDGFDIHIGVRYYENKLKESCIVYTMSNIIVIYKLELSTSNSTSTSNIVGHEMKILDIQIDKNYKIMISYDIESVFIWDLQNDEKVDPVILRVIHLPFGDTIKVFLAGISYCGKYLLIASGNIFISEPKNDDEQEDLISVEHYILQFWEWSYDRPEYDDLIYLPADYGQLINIRFNFNENEEKFFALSFSRLVAFGTVQYEKQKMNIFYPKCHIIHKINETCFLENSSLVVSCTKKGNIIVWNDNPLCENDNDNDEKQTINRCLYEKSFYKLVTLGLHDLSDIKNFSNYVVVTDISGDTRFYDYNFLLLYIWRIDLENPQHLLSICPGSKLSKKDAGSMTDFPKDLSLQHNVFYVQNFFIVNNIGEAYLCDIRKPTSKKLEFSASYRIYTDAFLTKPWLVFCLENGLVQIVNYNTRHVLAQYNIYTRMPLEHHSPITYCRIAPEENVIGIACRNGYLWMLDTCTCHPIHKRPIKVKNFVSNMAFWANKYCAVVDYKHTINILKVENGEWTSCTKLRYHIDRIINVFFIEYNEENYVISIGADRQYNKFNVNDSFTLVFQKRLEQKPKITAVNLFQAHTLYLDIDGDILFTANDLYKIVLYNAFTADKLYTFLGPVLDSPIQRIKYIDSTPDDPNSYFVVVSNKSLGVILLPLDGNPYRHSGVLAHHSNIYRVKISCEGAYVMIFGEGDSGGYFWALNRDAIKKNFHCGGEGLEPFCRLLPGGKNGWLFKEMQDYFYYFQVVSNALDSSEKTQISEYMKISEIPDFMRALGFFPSEFEIKDLIDEVTRTKYAWQQRPKDINFFDLVKLYINHKPLDGYSLEDMLNSIKVVGATAARFIVLDSAEINVTIDHLVTILTHKGENIPKIQAMKYIIELLSPQRAAMLKRCETEQTDEEIINKFHSLNEVSFSALEFCQKLLGIDTITDPVDRTVSLAVDSRTDPVLIYPELENRLPRVKEEDNSSDDDNVANKKDTE